MMHFEPAQIVIFVTALASVITSFLNRRSIREVHLSLNSRLDQLLKSTANAATLAERERNTPPKPET